MIGIAEISTGGQDLPPMKGHQIIAARALLGLTQAELAECAGVARSTVSQIEMEDGNQLHSSYTRLEDYLRSRGIRFTDEVGVIGRRPPASQPELVAPALPPKKSARKPRDKSPAS